jgi:hypothetical protein
MGPEMAYGDFELQQGQQTKSSSRDSSDTGILGWGGTTGAITDNDVKWWTLYIHIMISMEEAFMR